MDKVILFLGGSGEATSSHALNSCTADDVNFLSLHPCG
jgi:hypothetical protein